MTGDQRDPQAALRSLMAAMSEAFLNARIAQDPAFLALAEALARGEEAPEPRPCHCLCVKAHPSDRGACDAEAVTTRRFETRLLGPVDVPLCAPCAVAQGLAEMRMPGD